MGAFAPPILADRTDRRIAVLARVALWAIAVHAVSNIISAIAFGTFLVEPYPAWVATPLFLPWLTFGLLWGGQLTVLIGAVAGWAFLASRIGLRATNIAFAWIFVLTLLAELTGTHTGFPFGVYAYTERLGYRVFDLVPFSIPTSWFYMLVACLGICARLLPAKDDATSRWWWSLVGGALLTAWDVVLDPAMVKTWHWRWTPPDLSDAHPFVRFIGEPIVYGMPITNWLGWLLTGVLVSRVMLWLIPPTTWRRAVAPFRFPIVLYALNGLLPIAICLRQGMIPAGIAGLVVMGVPAWLAWRAPVPDAAGLATREGSPVRPSSD
jgi:putative membrane protein